MSKAAVKDKARRPKTAKAARPVADVAIAAAPVAPPADHAHRWRIETPNGEFSRGICSVCGAEKMFPNSAEDYLWEREVPQSRWTGRSDYKPSPVSEGY